MRHTIEGLPAAYEYEETVLGYYALFFMGGWITTCNLLEDVIAAAYGHQDGEGD